MNIIFAVYPTIDTWFKQRLLYADGLFDQGLAKNRGTISHAQRSLTLAPSGGSQS